MKTKWMIAAMAAAMVGSALAQTPNPLEAVENLPYMIVDKDDKPISNDVLKKRPLLLVFSARLWATRSGEERHAQDQNAFFKGVNEVLNSTKGLSAVSVVRTPDGWKKEGRAAVGITWPSIITKTGPDTPTFDSLRKLEEIIRAHEGAGSPPNTGVAIVIDTDGSITPIPSVEALKAKFAKGKK